MKLKVLGSSSTGNGYILENDTEALIIEAGMKPSTVKKALNFNINKVAGCLVTHAHNDHAKYAKDMVNNAIHVLSSQNVFEAKEIPLASPFVKIVQPGKGYKLRNFKIVPFAVHHDIPCLGFLVSHPEMGTMAFLTDTFMCEFTFPGLSHILIEANYADDILERNIQNGSVYPGMRPRLLSTHMEIETCKGILRANDLSQVMNIVLIHLSSANSDADRFQKEVTQISGKQVYVAEKGLMLQFNKLPY